MPKPVISKSKCNRCIDQESMLCIDVCPVEVLEKKGKEIIVKEPEACIGCRACEAQCPKQAIVVKDDEQ